MHECRVVGAHLLLLHDHFFIAFDLSGPNCRPHDLAIIQQGTGSECSHKRATKEDTKTRDETPRELAFGRIRATRKVQRASCFDPRLSMSCITSCSRIM